MTRSQPHDPRDQIADADPAARATDEQVLRDLARAKAAFQLRAALVVALAAYTSGDRT